LAFPSTARRPRSTGRWKSSRNSPPEAGPASTLETERSPPAQALANSGGRSRPRRLAVRSQLANVDIRLATGNDVGKHAPGATGHGPAQSDVPGIEIENGILRSPDDRRPVRRHRPETAPEAGRGNVTAAGEKVGDRMLKRLAAGLVQPQVVAGNLGRAADTNTIAQPRDGHLVGFVHDSGDRRLFRISDRHGDGVALDRIDGYRLAKAPHPFRRIGAHGHH